MTERNGGLMEDMISRQALCEYALNQKDKSITPNDIMRFPSAQPEKRTDKCTETHSCDCISRQEAIDAHYEYCNKHPDAGFPVWSLKILEDLPSAQPDLSGYSDKLWKAAYERGKAEAQQRWIPCSERLPEERQEILATTTDNAWGDVVIIRTYYKEMHKSVIAWMPLPEPYRKENR